ncbi:hypothetical protein MUCCIDRAFT_105215 [Mucor lusitanicus CBS 277.49]|uniref:Uncharacterized protein n=1 Tax=Mucor lusitanicus CBS 277.49 TaxID=747725 RepID=A0A168PUL0_MUCCL|nr:hypothetical protein MUCCIDRAFT_105215 [Mucor lusitanicus CBS 277.49]
MHPLYNEFQSIRYTVITIGFREEYKKSLERYVNIVNDTTMHVFFNNQYALHRKLKLSAKFNCNRADKSLMRNLQERFSDATYIMAN